MPIDVKTPESPGWWLQRLSLELRADLPRMQLLDRHFKGDPPLPTGAENAKPAYAAFQKKARTNLARLIVQAVRQRMKPRGFRTAADDDETGDEEAWQLWKRLGMTVRFSELTRSMGVYGRGYLIVGLDDNGQPVVTAEDAQQVITAHDPLSDKVIAALKMYHDSVAGEDVAYVYLPGVVHVAKRSIRRPATSQSVRFTPAAWDWAPVDSDDDMLDETLLVPGERLPDGLEDVVPVVRILNEDGVGEFEPHLDDLDRINHMLLQRMVIATMQAFRQRAIKGELPEVYPEGHPQAGQEIDYDGIFVADPGALWMIPAAAEIWESGQADIRPILDAVKDDMRMLSAASTTPLTMFNPEGANQTAEGAQSAKEDFVFKVEDRRDRAELGMLDALVLVYRFTGDTERAKREALQVIWAPAERLSIAERADAASKAGSSLPLKALLTEVWQFPPDVVDRYADQAEAEAEQDPVVRAARDLTGAA